jgi:hypothetical protein
VLGKAEFERAVQEARAAFEVAESREAVFASVGCRIEDAEILARAKYQLRLCVPDENAEHPVDWKGPLLALAHQQSEQAWLHGCLVGLLVAGPTTAMMDPMALQTAEKTITTEILAEEQRTKDRHSLNDRLRRLNLDPDALRELSMPVAARAAHPLLEFTMSGQELADSFNLLSGLWIIGVEIATQARRQHDHALAA